jgi:hypothetical protein
MIRLKLVLFDFVEGGADVLNLAMGRRGVT